ncbi:Alpha/Beta hydrolase protein [Aspergillus venezuelensis]
MVTALRSRGPEVFISASSNSCRKSSAQFPGGDSIGADERGLGQSPGVLDTMSPGTANCFFQVVEWAAGQAWLVGKVGLLGVSYYAGSQWRVAAKRPKGLACLIPWGGMSDYYRDRGLEEFEAPDPAESGSRGCIVVNIDARGVFDYEGDIFILGTQEGRDGHDTIERMAEQSWCNESVALVGNSWLAMSQWYIAAERPPHLKAITPWEGIGDFYRENVAAMIQKYPLMNAYWEDKRPRLGDINVPMHILASYSTGLHTEGSIRAWKNAGSDQKWFPFANDDLQRFLDHFLLGKDNGWESTPRKKPTLPFRVQYQKFYLDAANGKLLKDQPNQETQASYQSGSWGDDGAHFNLTFTEPTELIGSSQAVLYMSCADLNDMDVYIIFRNLDKEGTALLHFNIPFEHQLPNITKNNIPNVNIYKYVGPSGRLRASKRVGATSDEPEIAQNRRCNREPTELFFPHDREEKVVPGEVVELRIPIWPWWDRL